MILCLTGMMGCGKSSVGRALAERTGLPFRDLDEAVEARTGRRIPEIFRTDGEAAFRRLELEALEDLLARGEDAVLALGGGTVTTPRCAGLVRERTFCIYLRTSVDTLCERLSAGGEAAARPLLAVCNGPSAGLRPGGAPTDTGRSALRSRLEGLLAAREALYAAASRAAVDTDGRSPAALAEQILLLSPLRRDC